MKKVWIAYLTYFFFYAHELELDHKNLALPGGFLPEKLVLPYFCLFLGCHLKTHGSMHIGRKMLQE